MRGAGRAPCRQLRLCLVPCLLVAALAVTPIYDETLWTKVSWSKWKIDRDQFSISPSEETPGLLAQYGLKDVLHNSLEGPLPRPTKKTQKDPIIDAEALNDDTYLPAASMAVKCSVCHSLAVHVWRRLVDEVLRGNLSVQLAPLYVEKYMTEACENEVPLLLQRKVIYKLEVSSADQEMTFFVLRGRKPGTSPTWSEYAAVEAACKDLTYHDHQELARVLHTHLKDLKRSLNKLLRSYGMRDPYGVDLFGKDGEEEDEGGAAGAGSGATPAGSTDEGSTDKGSTEAGSTEADSQAGSPKPMTAGKHGDAGKWGKKRSQKAGSGAGVPASEAEAAAETGIGGPAAEELPPLLKAAGIEEGDLPMAKQVLHEMAVKLLKGLAVQLRRDALAQLAQQEVAGGPGAALMEEEEEEDDDEYQDPDDLDDEDEDAGEEVDEAGEPCRDLHPMCEQWANEGECDANPAYMVGNARLKGHCRKACGVCTPSARLSTPAELLASLPSLSKTMRELNKAVLKAVRSQVCTLRQACLSSGDEVAASGNVIAAKAPGYANLLQTFKGVPHGTGFVLGRPYWGVPEVKETPASKDVYQQQLAAEQEGSGAAAAGAAAADGSQVAGGGAGGGQDSSLEQLKRRVAEVPGAELGGKLLQMHEDFFTYEYLYKNHTRQFHDEPRLSGKKVTENWSLGTFSRESVVVESVLEQLDLLPAQTKADPGYGMSKFTWRYIKQVYNQGDVCQLGGGRTAVRRTEVRIACSPDSKIHLLIREPDFCQYVFVIYSPALCSLDHYKPQPKSSNAPR